MTYNFRAIGFVAIGVLSCLAFHAARAQDPQASKLYDQGVNAFFAGRLGQAESFLSNSIAFNSQDPRAYYFRALSLLRQGRVDQARGDMLVGATVEAQLPHRYAIGAALERVQGPNRLMLEEFRRNAHRNVAAQTAASANAPVRNTTFVERDSAVLRDKRIVPLEELLRPGGPQAIVDEPARTSSPALPPQGNAPAATAAGQPAETPAAAPNDPFGDDSERPAPQPAPAVKTPPQEAPQPAPPANPPAAPDEKDPFGGS
jgi:hypothetical protein